MLLSSATAFAQGAPAATLEQAPRLLKFIAATPPPELTGRGRVDVVLTIDVDEAGKVANVTVATSAGAPFDEPAVAAARQFEFTPGVAGGKPVPVRITYRYAFLEKVAPPAPTTPPPTGEAAPTTAAPAGQTVPLDGTVREKGERIPFPNVTVRIDDLVAVTDADGAFHFDAVPVGAHRVALIGPDVAAAAQLTLKLEPQKRLEVTWYLARKQRYTSTVRGQHVVQETVEHTLSGDELRRIPGTQGDTLRAVQSLPGVARAAFGGGAIIVWGTSPNSTRSYVDGVYIPTLYHFGGLRSTVNSEMVQDLSFRPGGFGVEYGRGYGGVIEIDTRKPKDSGIHGFVQLDAIDASLMLDAKLTKTLSLTVAARRSTIDAWLPYVTPNSFQLTPSYWDYQLKLRWKPTPRDDLEVFFFGSDDSIKVTLRRPDPSASAALDSHTFYHRFLARYQRRFGRTTLTVTPWIGYDQPISASGTFGNTAITFNVATLAYGLRAVARVPLTSWLRLDGGIDFEGTRWTFAGSAPFAGATRGGGALGGGVGGSPGLIQDSTSIYNNFAAPFIALTFALLNKKLTITPGLRLDIYSSAGYFGTPFRFSHAYVNPEPRLQMRYQINRWAAIKAATGVYFQPTQTFNLVRAVGNPNLLPEQGWHYVVGADFDPTPTLHLEIEGFYKDLRLLTVPGEHYGDPIQTNDGVGRVYGGELLVRQELARNFFGWIAYTVSRSERRDHPDTPWRSFSSDQTHILTILGSYKLPRGYQVGLRFRYVTGNPFTPIKQTYLNANNGGYVSLPGEPFSQRLSDFHQLDVRFDKTWTFDRWRLSVYLDIQNLYNYRSEEQRQYNFNFMQSQPVTGLPFVPDLGIRGDF
ncbi:MAG: TonB family protein / TonB-dependent receptor [Myxococcales bacterium]|nr:TonB family protein / TonB-dependent receptor [Myxococcales bacterium]